MDLILREAKGTEMVYMVRMEKETVTVIRPYYPNMDGTYEVTFTVGGPIEKAQVYAFLKELFPLDFTTPILYRKHRLGHSTIREGFYSLEGALDVGETIWKDSQPSEWDVFYIKACGDVIRDWVAEHERNGRRDRGRAKEDTTHAKVYK